jgi:hypothetical protein
MDVDENGAMSSLRYWSEPDNRHEVALYTTPPAAQPAPVQEPLPQCTHNWVSNPKEKWCLRCGAQEADHIAGGGKMMPPAPQPAPVQEPVAKRYCCHSCFKASGGVMLDRMILCSECGNKRCPKASDHNFSCTGSNEPGQWGSIYNTPPAPQPVPVKTCHDGKPWPVAPKPWVDLTDEEIDLFINGRGDEDDDNYVEPTGDGFGLTDADLKTLVRRAEAKLREKNGGAA